MKKYLILALIFFLSATPVFGAFSYKASITIDHTKVHGDSDPLSHTTATGNTTTVTSSGIDTTGATLLVVTVADYQAVGAGTVTDSNSNTWHALTSYSSSSSRSTIWYAYDKSGGALSLGSGHTFTYTNGSAAFPSIQVAAFNTGWTGSDPFDVQNGANATSDNVSTGNITPSVNNELIITCSGSNISGAPFVKTGIVKTIDTSSYVGGTAWGSGNAYVVQPTAAAVSVNWKNTNSSTLSTAIASFKTNGLNLANYPVLVSGTYAGAGGIPDLRTTGNGGKVQNANGYDIYFYSDSALTTRIPAERERYNASTGQYIGFLKKTVSNTSDTVVYIAYGDSGISTDPNSDGTYGATSVWGSYGGVWHLPNGSSLTSNDSTSNANNSSSQTGVTATAGQIDGAASFDGTSGHEIIMPNTASLQSVGGTLTLSSWVNFNSGAPAGGFLSMYLNGGSGSYVLGAFSNNIYFWVDDNSNAGYLGRKATQPADSNWHYVVGVYNGGLSTANTQIYVDGVQTDNADFTSGTFSQMRTSGDVLKIGGLNGGLGGPFTGLLDEARLLAKDISPDWVLTDYNNQSSPSTFYTMGAETAVGGGGGGSIIQRVLFFLFGDW